MMSFMLSVVTLPPQLAGLKYDYFDGIVVVWLIIGLLWGRKRGMTQQFLPMLQWIGIVVVGGVFYRPVSRLVHEYAEFGQLWSNIFAYVLLGFGVHLVYLIVKHAIGEKLTGSDFFGRGEYYLGMLAGMVRFACMVLAMLALMNSRIITKAEMAKTEKMQSDNFSDIRFPTYGSVQQAFLFESFTGNVVESNLQVVLIYPVTPEKPHIADTHAHRQEQMINDILGGGKR
jgi:uncharacterized membrane protein required for colicin V production